MERIFGGLIEFEDTEDFDNFLNTMDDKQAILVLEKSIEFGLHNSMFNLMEASALYKCLNKLKQNANKNQGDSIHNDDTDRTPY